MSDHKYETPCPMPGCDEQLHVVWSLAYSLGPGDHDAPKPGDAHTESWQIECGAGHVVLLPDPDYCPTYPDCEHNDDDHDFSEDSRVLRDGDMERLRHIAAVLFAGEAS